MYPMTSSLFSDSSRARELLRTPFSTRRIVADRGALNNSIRVSRILNIRLVGHSSGDKLEYVIEDFVATKRMPSNCSSIRRGRVGVVFVPDLSVPHNTLYIDKILDETPHIGALLQMPPPQQVKLNKEPIRE